jgi:hypothetical protein
MAFSKSTDSEVTGEMQLSSFAPLSARRLLVLGGIGLVLVGMLFGDIFAVFVLHQNAARVRAWRRPRMLLWLGIVPQLSPVFRT